MSGDITQMRAPAPVGEPTRYSKEQIVELLRGTNPQAVSSSGQGYLEFAGSYGQMRTNLRGLADDLAHVWKGPAAAGAQAQLRDLFVSAHEINTRAHQVGTAVKTHGDSYLSWYKDSMPTPDTDADAQAWMNYANRRVGETWNALPPELTTTLPPVSNAAQQTAGQNGGSPTGGGRTDQDPAGGRHPVPGRHDEGGADGRFGPGDELSLRDRYGRPYDSGGGSGGADLASFGGPSGAGLGGGMGGPGVPGSMSGGLGGTGGLPGLGGTGAGEVPTAAGPLAGGGLPSTGGTSTAPSGPGAAVLGTGRPAGAAPATGMRPTGGSGVGGPVSAGAGGQGSGEREQTRSKWSPEDRETWTGKSRPRPGVVGEPDGAADKKSRSSKPDEDEDGDPAEEHDGDENEPTDEPAGESRDDVPDGVEESEESEEEPDAEDPFGELEAEISLEDLDLPDGWQL